MPEKRSTRGRKTNLQLRENSFSAIVDSALKLFVKRGFGPTTMEQIATGAKLTKGGIYFYFPKKEAILISLLDSIELEYLTESCKYIDEKHDGAVDRIIALLHWQVSYSLRKPQHVMLLVMISVELSGKSDEASLRIERIYRTFHSYVQNSIQKGIERGELRTQLTPREFASFYVAAHDGVMLEWYRRQREIDGVALVRVFRQALLGGLSGAVNNASHIA